MKAKKLIFLMMVIVLVTTVRCQKDKSCEFAGCNPERKTIKIAQNARGQVGIFDVSHPDLWSIVSDEGIIGNSNPTYDTRDIVIPCNLPYSLKIEGLKIIFSGKLKESCNDFDTSWNPVYYCTMDKISRYTDK